jgi:hypothetical protein
VIGGRKYGRKRSAKRWSLRKSSKGSRMKSYARSANLTDRRKTKTGLEERKSTNRDELTVNACARNNERSMTSEKENDKKDTSGGGEKTGTGTATGTVTAVAPATGNVSVIVLLTIAWIAACLLGPGT